MEVEDAEDYGALYEDKYNNIIKFLDAYVNNNQNDLDKINERSGPSNIYDDKQLNLSSHDIMKQIKLKLEMEINFVKELLGMMQTLYIYGQ